MSWNTINPSKYLESQYSYQKQIKLLQEEHQKQISKLQQEINNLKEQNSELQEFKDKIISLLFLFCFFSLFLGCHGNHLQSGGCSWDLQSV